MSVFQLLVAVLMKPLRPPRKKWGPGLLGFTDAMASAKPAKQFGHSHGRADDREATAILEFGEDFRTKAAGRSFSDTDYIGGAQCPRDGLDVLIDSVTVCSGGVRVSSGKHATRRLSLANERQGGPFPERNLEPGLMTMSAIASVALCGRLNLKRIT